MAKCKVCEVEMGQVAVPICSEKCWMAQWDIIHFNDNTPKTNKVN